MRGERLDLSERVEVTTDDATAASADALVAVLQGHGFAVERRTFIRAVAEEPRRVVLLALAARACPAGGAADRAARPRAGAHRGPLP